MTENIHSEDFSLDELIEFYKQRHQVQEKLIKYKYALYIRKSTDESDKQERSIEDQKSECEQYAEKNGFKDNIKECYSENVSARVAGKRPEFNRMLRDIESGKINSILCWSPSRLARNMKEAGILLDLLDKNVILDIKSPTFTYNKDASSKMMLSLQFALAKQFSDQLSVDVTRGLYNTTEDGKAAGQIKHGYKINENGVYVPDEETFHVISHAFEMCLNRALTRDIALYLKENYVGAWSQKQKKRRRPPTWDSSVVIDLLKDPIYTGMKVYGLETKFIEKQVVVSKMSHFEPIISPSEHLEIINRFGKTKVYKKTEYNFLKGMCICAHCEATMQIFPQSKKTKRGKEYYYMYAYCRTKKCPQNGKGKWIRGWNLWQGLTRELKTLVTQNETAAKALTDYTETKLKEQYRLNLALIRSEVTSLKRERNNTNDQLNDLVTNMRSASTFKEHEFYEHRIKTLKKNVLNIAKKIKDREGEIKRMEELFSSSDVKLSLLMLQNAEFIEKIEDADIFIRNLVSNFLIHDKNHVIINLKEPLAEFLSDKMIMVDGRGFEPLTSSVQTRRSTN